jgi:hypothetical protein
VTGPVAISLLKHQVTFLQSTKRFVALVGGFGCGKSYACGAKAYALASVNHGYDGALISRSSKQLRDFLIPEVEKFFRTVNANYTFKDGNKIIIDWGADKSVIHLLTTENDAYQRWAGGNWAWAVIDEIDTHTKPAETWAYTNDRIRVKAPQLQTACASTPEGFGFLYNFFEKEPQENTPLSETRQLIKGCTLDNPHLDIEYVRSQIQTRNPLQLRAYIYGEFVNMQGSPVYWRFDRDLNLTTKTLADFPNHVLHLGVDFNKGINATTVAVIKNNHAYFVDEIYGCKDTQLLANEIKKRFPWHAANNAIRFYPDASGFEGIQTLKRNFPEHALDGQPNFRYSAANPKVERRVAAFNDKFKPVGREPECFINANRCPELFKGITQQVYDKGGDPDKHSGIDHALDGAGYFIYRTWPLTGTPTARIA